MSRHLLSVAAIVALAAATGCSQRPARIVGTVADTVLVSSLHTVRIPARVLDAGGRIMPTSGIRYRRIAGAPIPTSFSGLVRCAESATATVRASLGDLHSELHILCRPVRELRTAADMEFLVGDSARAIPMQAIGVDGRPLALFAGTVSSHDTSVARLDGLRIQPGAAGATWVDVVVGDYARSVSVTVYERVNSLQRLHVGQPVAVPVSLASGESRQWSVPPGSYVLSMLEGRSRTPPALAVDGAICSRLGFLASGSFYCVAKTSASVIAYRPWVATDTSQAIGHLAVRPVEVR